MNGKILIAALLLLTGCSIADATRKVVYDTHGKSDAQFAADKNVCEYETNKIFAAADNSTTLAEWPHMFHQCLESKGYTPK